MGCWSGSFLVDQGGRGTILYTRIAADDWGQGKVALARGDASFRRWETTADDVVIDGPPPGLGVHFFRGPYVFRFDGGWTMVMGAGLADGLGAALQYRSADLRHWSYDGVLCSRLSSPEDQVWTGALWECPQLFPLGGDWVLLVSVWDADELHYVAGAIGDYDGRKFSPRSWQRLTYGSSAYAMSSFVDKDDKRCVISWLREEPRNNPSLVQRAGAHSVASLLVREEDGLLGLRPHTDVMALAGPASPFRVEGSSELCGHGGPVLVTLSPATADQLALAPPAPSGLRYGLNAVATASRWSGPGSAIWRCRSARALMAMMLMSWLTPTWWKCSPGAVTALSGSSPAVTVGLPSSSSLG